MVFQRLFWKEYRVQRGFWFSMACFAVACQLIVLLIPERTIPHNLWLLGLALGIPAFYALGCGATLFAAEREDGTLEQLRILAAPKWKVWWSKLGFSVVSIVVLLALLWVMAFNLSLGKTLQCDQANLWGFWGLLTVEFLAWGIFFSLLTKRPLNAACMAAVASLGTALVIQWFTSSHRQILLAPGIHNTVPLHWFLQVVGLFALDAWIASRWVLDRPARQRCAVPETAEKAALRSLGVRVAAATGAAFVAIALLPALVVLSTWPPVPWMSFVQWNQVLLFWAVPVAEAFAWGAFFALRTRWTIVAALLAAVAGFVSCHLLTICLALTMYRSKPMHDLEPWLNAIPLRMLVALIVLVLDVWLAVQWRAIRGATRRLKHAAAERKRAQARPASMLRGLVWQERRQAWLTITVFWIVAIGLLAFYRVADPVRDETSFIVAVVVAGILSSLMGSCAFLAEQEGQRFRFLADHGVGSRQVWFAKQLIWFPAALATAALFCWISYGSLRRVPSRFAPLSDLGGTWLLLPLMTYCCGQFTSMLLVRGLVAGLLALVIAFFVFLWQLVIQHLGVSLWWSVMPIPLVLLIATWLRAPGWMLERRGWRAWMPLITLLLVPLFGLPAAVAAYRVYEIPATSPSSSLQQAWPPVTRDETETAAMYRRAIALLVSMSHVDPIEAKAEPKSYAEDGWEHATPVEREWLAANREALEITLQASRRGPCVFYDPNDRRIDTPLDAVYAVRELAWLLLLDARRLEFEGDYDKALDNYLATLRLAHHIAAQGTMTQFMIGDELDARVCERMPRWAARLEQTADRIRGAIHKLDEVFRSGPALADSIKVEYQTLRRAMETDFESLAVDSGQVESPIQAVLIRLVPTEHARALRLLDYRTAETLQYVAEVSSALASGRPPSAWRPTVQAGYDENSLRDRWAETSVLPMHGRAELWGALPIHAESHRRALKIVLALEGWRMEHGDLPRTQDILVGDYFDRLPLDPWTAKPFGYAPRGLESSFRLSSPAGFIKPGQALLWSPGPNASTIRQVGTTEDGYARFEVWQGGVGSSGALFQMYPIP